MSWVKRVSSLQKPFHITWHCISLRQAEPEKQFRSQMF
uniref:Uncharacterized protein n=1 Tax=Arundo donax TaxID=35708 RepID=A0A0A9GTY4_ARUDO